MSELACRRLEKHFGNLHVTRTLDLEVSTGEVHALIGPNGAGKTTALSQLSGELSPDGGSVLLDAVNITGVDLPGRVDLGICRSYQTSSPFTDFTVVENVILAILAAEEKRFRFWRRASADIARRRQALDLLEMVGLEQLAGIPVTALDHGASRQLEIATVLATHPTILLLDEPMAGMAPGEAKTLAQLIGSLRERHGILLVEHDMDVVFSVADRITVLSEGAVIASGIPADIRGNLEVQALYLRDES
jgi:branched-chain amino acid transport system ATP-binding protein